MARMAPRTTLLFHMSTLRLQRQEVEARRRRHSSPRSRRGTDNTATDPKNHAHRNLDPMGQLGEHVRDTRSTLRIRQPGQDRQKDSNRHRAVPARCVGRSRQRLPWVPTANLTVSKTCPVEIVRMPRVLVFVFVPTMMRLVCCMRSEVMAASIFPYWRICWPAASRHFPIEECFTLISRIDNPSIRASRLPECQQSPVGNSNDKTPLRVDHSGRSGTRQCSTARVLGSQEIFRAIPIEGLRRIWRSSNPPHRPNSASQRNVWTMGHHGVG